MSYLYGVGDDEDWYQVARSDPLEPFPPHNNTQDIYADNNSSDIHADLERQVASPYEEENQDDLVKRSEESMRLLYKLMSNNSQCIRNPIDNCEALTHEIERDIDEILSGQSFPDPRPTPAQKNGKVTKKARKDEGLASPIRNTFGSGESAKMSIFEARLSDKFLGKKQSAATYMHAPVEKEIPSRATKKGKAASKSKYQRSNAEFMSENLGLSGFGDSGDALVYTVREMIENAMDANANNIRVAMCSQRALSSVILVLYAHSIRLKEFCDEKLESTRTHVLLTMERNLLDRDKCRENFGLDGVSRGCWASNPQIESKDKHWSGCHPLKSQFCSMDEESDADSQRNAFPEDDFLDIGATSVSNESFGSDDMDIQNDLLAAADAFSDFALDACLLEAETVDSPVAAKRDNAKENHHTFLNGEHGHESKIPQNEGDCVDEYLDRWSSTLLEDQKQIREAYESLMSDIVMKTTLQKLYDSLLSSKMIPSMNGPQISGDEHLGQDDWVIEVLDDGVGIPPLDIPNLLGQLFSSSKSNRHQATFHADDVLNDGLKNDSNFGNSPVMKSDNVDTIAPKSNIRLCPMCHKGKQLANRPLVAADATKSATSNTAVGNQHMYSDNTARTETPRTDQMPKKLTFGKYGVGVKTAILYAQQNPVDDDSHILNIDSYRLLDILIKTVSFMQQCLCRLELAQYLLSHIQSRQPSGVEPTHDDHKEFPLASNEMGLERDYTPLDENNSYKNNSIPLHSSIRQQNYRRSSNKFDASQLFFATNELVSSSPLFDLGYTFRSNTLPSSVCEMPLFVASVTNKQSSLCPTSSATNNHDNCSALHIGICISSDTPVKENVLPTLIGPVYCNHSPREHETQSMSPDDTTPLTTSNQSSRNRDKHVNRLQLDKLSILPDLSERSHTVNTLKTAEAISAAVENYLTASAPLEDSVAMFIQPDEKDLCELNQEVELAHMFDEMDEPIQRPGKDLTHIKQSDEHCIEEQEWLELTTKAMTNVPAETQNFQKEVSIELEIDQKWYTLHETSTSNYCRCETSPRDDNASQFALADLSKRVMLDGHVPNSPSSGTLLRIFLRGSNLHGQIGAEISSYFLRMGLLPCRGDISFEAWGLATPTIPASLREILDSHLSGESTAKSSPLDFDRMSMHMKGGSDSFIGDNVTDIFSPSNPDSGSCYMKNDSTSQRISGIIRRWSVRESLRNIIRPLQVHVPQSSSLATVSFSSQNTVNPDRNVHYDETGDILQNNSLNEVFSKSPSGIESTLVASEPPYTLPIMFNCQVQEEKVSSSSYEDEATIRSLSLLYDVPLRCVVKRTLQIPLGSIQSKRRDTKTEVNEDANILSIGTKQNPGPSKTAHGMKLEQMIPDTAYLEFDPRHLDNSSIFSEEGRITLDRGAALASEHEVPKERSGSPEQQIALQCTVFLVLTPPKVKRRPNLANRHDKNRLTMASSMHKKWNDIAKYENNTVALLHILRFSQGVPMLRNAHSCPIQLAFRSPAHQLLLTNRDLQRYSPYKDNKNDKKEGISHPNRTALDTGTMHNTPSSSAQQRQCYDSDPCCWRSSFITTNDFITNDPILSVGWHNFCLDSHAVQGSGVLFRQEKAIADSTKSGQGATGIEGREKRPRSESILLVQDPKSRTTKVNPILRVLNEQFEFDGSLSTMKCNSSTILGLEGIFDNTYNTATGKSGGSRLSRRDNSLGVHDPFATAFYSEGYTCNQVNPSRVNLHTEYCAIIDHAISATEQMWLLDPTRATARYPKLPRMPKPVRDKLHENPSHGRWSRKKQIHRSNRTQQNDDAGKFSLSSHGDSPAMSEKVNLPQAKELDRTDTSGIDWKDTMILTSSVSDNPYIPFEHIHAIVDISIVSTARGEIHAQIANVNRCDTKVQLPMQPKSIAPMASRSIVYNDLTKTHLSSSGHPCSEEAAEIAESFGVEVTQVGSSGGSSRSSKLSSPSVISVDHSKQDTLNKKEEPNDTNRKKRKASSGRKLDKFSRLKEMQGMVENPTSHADYRISYTSLVGVVVTNALVALREQTAEFGVIFPSPLETNYEIFENQYTTSVASEISKAMSIAGPSSSLWQRIVRIVLPQQDSPTSFMQGERLKTTERTGYLSPPRLGSRQIPFSVHSDTVAESESIDTGGKIVYQAPTLRQLSASLVFSELETDSTKRTFQKRDQSGTQEGNWKQSSGSGLPEEAAMGRLSSHPELIPKIKRMDLLLDPIEALTPTTAPKDLLVRNKSQMELDRELVEQFVQTRIRKVAGLAFDVFVDDLFNQFPKATLQSFVQQESQARGQSRLEDSPKPDPFSTTWNNEPNQNNFGILQQSRFPTTDETYLRYMSNRELAPGQELWCTESDVWDEEQAVKIHSDLMAMRSETKKQTVHGDTAAQESTVEHMGDMVMFSSHENHIEELSTYLSPWTDGGESTDDTAGEELWDEALTFQVD